MLPQLTLPSKPPPVWTTNPSHNKDDHHSIPTPLEHSFPPSSATSTRFDLASSSTNSSHLFRQESLAKKPDGTQSAGLPTLASSNPISPPDLIKPFPLDHNVHLDQPLRPNYTSADAAPPLISPTATDPSPDTPLHIGFSSAPTTNGEIGERGRHQQPLHFTHDPSRRSDGPEAQEQADATSIFGTAPVGLIGKTKPRAVVRIERDYSARGATSGRVQFWDGWVAELEGRVSPIHCLLRLHQLTSRTFFFTIDHATSAPKHVE